MKINFNKKTIIGNIIFLALIAAGLFYFYSSYKIFSGEIISFSYPKQILIEGPSTSRLYKRYHIRKEGCTSNPKSYIYIDEPIQNNDKIKKLSDDIRSEFVSLIHPITVNGIEGDAITYSLNEQPVREVVAIIYLFSDYKNTPIVLFYSRSDTDDCLDRTWDLILKTLKVL